MSDPELIDLLQSIHQTQQTALARQEEHLALFQAHLEETRQRIDESVELQRLAVDRQKQITRLALPLIAACVALIGYLVVAYL